MKILVIDIGNTFATLGIYTSRGISKYLKTLDPFDSNIKAYLKSINVDAVSIASVVPERNDSWKKVLIDNGFKNIFWINHQ